MRTWKNESLTCDSDLLCARRCLVTSENGTLLHGNSHQMGICRRNRAKSHGQDIVYVLKAAVPGQARRSISSDVELSMKSMWDLAVYALLSRDHLFMVLWFIGYAHHRGEFDDCNFCAMYQFLVQTQLLDNGNQLRLLYTVNLEIELSSAHSLLFTKSNTKSGYVSWKSLVT